MPAGARGAAIERAKEISFSAVRHPGPRARRWSACQAEKKIALRRNSCKISFTYGGSEKALSVLISEE